MNIKLDLAEGKWRNLSKKELKEIDRLVVDSAKTFD